MKYEFGYAVCSLAFLTVVAVHYFQKKSYPSLQNHIYGKVMLLALADLVLDIVGSWTIMHAQMLPPWINYAINTPFYIIQTIMPVALFMYVLAVAEELRARKRLLMGAILLPAAIGVLALLSNYATRWIFYADPGQTYTRGPYFYWLYGSVAFYLILTLLALLHYRKNFIKVQFTTILLFLIFVAAGVYIQYLFPEYLLSSMVIALAITMMFFAMQIPEDMLDAVTGVFNHAALMRYIDSGVRHRRKMLGFAVSIEGLLHQGQHLSLSAMNEAVKQMADYLERLCPKGWVFRMSASVYVMLTEDAACYEKAAEELKETELFHYETAGSIMRLPLAVCAFSEGGLVTSSTNFTRLVETAFQKAKALGQKGLIQIDPETIADLNRYAAVESAITKALRQDDFELRFQPIYSLGKERFVSAEALIRLSDPGLGDIPAQEIVSIAEANGTIVQIDRQVLRRACRFIREHGPLGRYGLDMITVNVSTVDLLQDDLYESIISIILDEGIPFDAIGLEITETVSAAFSDDLIVRLQSFAQKGIRLLLDDFGTGYSNLYRIANLPLYAVKMDHSMFSAYESGTQSAVLFEEMIHLCKQLGFLVIVEGINRPAQIDELRRLGVDRIQGFHYSKPLPAREFLGLFQ
jgi:EAL domain-containing protein (putative c-di-GMP-specific phosphodiesterase class I)